MNMVNDELASAEALLKSQKWDEAIPHLRQALKLRPDLPSANVGLGLAMRGKGRPEEAIACFQQALKFDSNSVEAPIGLTVCLRDLARFDEAERFERPLLESAPNNQIVQSNRLFHLYFDPKQDMASIRASTLAGTSASPRR